MNKNLIVQFSMPKLGVIAKTLSSNSLKEDVMLTLLLLCSDERLSSLKKMKSAPIFSLFSSSWLRGFETSRSG